MDKKLNIENINELRETDEKIAHDKIKGMIDNFSSFRTTETRTASLDKIFGYLYVNKWYLDLPKCKSFREIVFCKLLEFNEKWEEANLYYDALDMERMIVIGDYSTVHKMTQNLLNAFKTIIGKEAKIKICDKMFQYILVNKWFIEKSNNTKLRESILCKLLEFEPHWDKAKEYHIAFQPEDYVEEKDSYIIHRRVQHMLDQTKNCKTKESKIAQFDRLFNYIYINEWFLDLPEYKTLKDAVLSKLLELKHDWNKANHYYEIFTTVEDASK
jgi:hypothetical protein